MPLKSGLPASLGDLALGFLQVTRILALDPFQHSAERLVFWRIAVWQCRSPEASRAEFWASDDAPRPLFSSVGFWGL
jgi:hypothetical protein